MSSIVHKVDPAWAERAWLDKADYVEKYRRRGIRLEDAASVDLLDEHISRQTSICLEASGAGPEEWESLSDEVAGFRSETLWLADYAADISMVLNRMLDDGLTGIRGEMAVVTWGYGPE